MPKFISYFLFFVLLSLTGCLRQELPVPMHQTGDVVTASVDMDPDYKYQIYFNLKNNTEVGKHEKTIWDLGFTSSPSGYQVILNSAKSMFALATTRANFAAVSFADTLGFAAARRCDAPSGSPDSTAFADWRTSNPIYIIDRGFDALGVHQGWAKVQILSADSLSYTFRAAALASSNDNTFTVIRDTTYSYSYFSLSSFSPIIVQPPRNTWDIVFTQYTHIFTDQNPPVTYLVTGCLLNSYNTQAYIDTTTPFADITYTHVQPLFFTPAINTIGYNWKTYTGTIYTVNPAITYIIRSADGLFFKLHFTGFYSASGIKGSPQWEYQQL